MEYSDEERVHYSFKKEQKPLNCSIIFSSKPTELTKRQNEEKHCLSAVKSKKKKKNKKKKKMIIIAQNKARGELNRRSKSAKKKKLTKKDKVEAHINRFSTMKLHRDSSGSSSLMKSLTIKQISLMPSVQFLQIKHNIQVTKKVQMIPIKEVIKKESTNLSNINFKHLKEKEKNSSQSVIPNKSLLKHREKEEKHMENIDNTNNEHKSRVNGYPVSSSSVKCRSNYQDRKSIFQLREEKGERIAQVRKEFSDKKFSQVNCYTYIIKQGNASHLIKNCMNHRINWKEPFSPVTSLFNFKWQQLSYGIDYPRISKIASIKQVVNHFEFHSSLSNKSVMFINFLKYCEDNSMSVFKYAPLTIILKTDKPNTSFYSLFDNIKEYICDYQNINESSDKYAKQENNFSKWFPFEKDENYSIGLKTMIQIPRTHYQGKNLWVVKASNLNRGQCIKVVDSIDKIELWIKMFNEGIELGYDAEETDQSHRNNITNIHDSGYGNNNSNGTNNHQCTISLNISHELNQSYSHIANTPLTQTITPALNQTLNQTLNLNQFKLVTSSTTKTNDTQCQAENKTARPEVKQDKTNQIQNQLTQSNSQSESKKKIYQSNRIIIQKYIESPFLYRGRKCDMRIWVLITQKMKVYIFKEGHLKTCSVKYDINVNDTYVHITNYSFQKHASDFGKYEDGNEVPFSDLKKFLAEEHSERNISLSDILTKIKEIIKYTTKSVCSKINKLNRNYSFEIFGYDFMLDSDFNVFLIEINTNPGYEISSPWIKVIIPRMLDDSLRLTIDVMFDTKYCFDAVKIEDCTEFLNQCQSSKREEIERMLANTIPLNESNKEEDLIGSNVDNETIINQDKPNSTPSSLNTQTIITNPLSVKCNENSNTGIKDGISKTIVVNEQRKDDLGNNNENNISNTNPIKQNKSYEIIDKNNSPIKYKSPFPVPGYDDSDNLWGYICDLNEEAIQEKEKDKMQKQKECKSYYGIKHLLKQKTKAKR